MRLFDRYTKARAEVQQFNDPDDNRQVIDIKIHGEPKASKAMLNFIRTNIESLHREFKNINVKERIACDCETCRKRMSNKQKPSFYDHSELHSMLEDGLYKVYCKHARSMISIGEILNDLGWEEMAKRTKDVEFARELRHMGLNFTQVINKPHFDNKPHLEFKPVNRNENTNTNMNTVSVEVKLEIGNLLDEMSLLKEDINSELAIEGVPEKEIQKLVQDVGLAEKALEEIETTGKEPKRPAKTRIKRFFNDLQDEESSLRKGLGKLRKGRDYGVKLAETFNKVASNLGMPLVPPLALDVIKAI